MLEVKNLSKKYRNTLAVDNVSFTVSDGEIGILLGPNGAGKSTIIKSISGLVRSQGQVLVNGVTARLKEGKQIFSYVPEIPAMYPTLTVREHIEFIRRAYGSPITDEEIDYLLTRFELDDKKDKLGDELSKGMMQKVSICCALCVKPKVMMLDEPMVGLDPKAIKELKKVIIELKEQGTSILLSTHMLEMVKDIWDVVYIMDKGHIVRTFTKDEVRHEDIEEMFFAVTEGVNKDE